MKKVPFQSTEVILREYDFDSDPEKLVVHLFNQMGSLEENIQSVKEGDKWFHERFYYRKRFVAEIKDELVATTTVERGLSLFTEHRYTLHAVVTAKHYQGTGLSQLLFDFIKEWIKEQKGKLILVETWEDNIAARKFYEKLGFQQYASLPNGLKNRNGEGFVSEILYVYEIGF